MRRPARGGRDWAGLGRLLLGPKMAETGTGLMADSVIFVSRIHLIHHGLGEREHCSIFSKICQDWYELNDFFFFTTFFERSQKSCYGYIKFR